MLFVSAPGPRWGWRGAGRGAAAEPEARGAGARRGRLPGPAAPPGQRHRHPAGIAAPPAAAAPGASPVLLVVGGRLLLSVVLLLLLALQKDVVAAGSRSENVLKDAGRWMLEAVFIVNVQLMYFETQH